MAFIERTKTESKAARDSEVQSFSDYLNQKYGEPYKGDDE